jgi:hypothetical protein
MIRFNLPSLAELDRIGSKERLNLIRQYFSASRYNRLIIQQCLIKSAYDESFISTAHLRCCPNDCVSFDGMYYV